MAGLYDGDGNRVKSTVNGATTYFVGAFYEETNGVVTTYYGVYPEPVEGLGHPHRHTCTALRLA